MCGRFFQDLSEAEVSAHFAAAAPAGEAGAAGLPRYNISPGQDIWVVRPEPRRRDLQPAEAGAPGPGRRLEALHWGLIPHYAADRQGAYRRINARAESVERAPAFRAAFAKRRCLVVAHGFYEWRKQGKQKQPFAIARADGAPLGLAGVWENWLDKSTGEWLRSVAIITTDANEQLRRLHDRMPVIIAPGDYARWLGEQPANEPQLKALMRARADEPLRIWPVSPRMNRAAVEDASILEEVPSAEPERPEPKRQP